MPNYNQPYQFYAGVDLHARSMFVQKIGRTVYHLWRRQCAFDVKRFLA
jgi:hypothetical protein